ncbi:MAG: permease prefix domain 1-containing protein [Bacteroidales bacterium]|nr:permease prefix domain 1-containing protein [Clostridium sp.]MCM1202509.1 permease prefix domain 1-containing protein [Bacteroidales bacterium]
MKAEEYLTLLTEQIRCKKAKAGVRDELLQHINDQKESLLKEGMTEEEAETEAVRQMGDPVEAGMELDRIHKPQMEWGIIALAAFLSIIGVVVQYLLKNHFGKNCFLPSTGKALVSLAVGMACMTGICIMDYRVIGRNAGKIYLALLAVLFWGTCFYGLRINGVYVIYLRDSSSLLCLLFIPLYGAVCSRYYGQGYGAVLKSILWMQPVFLVILLGLGGVPMLMVTGLSFVIILSAAVCKSWFKVSKRLVLSVLWGGTLLTPIAGVVMISRWGSGHLQSRMQVWLHPYRVDAEHQYGRIVKEFLAENQWIGTNAMLEQENWERWLPDGSNYALAYIGAYYGILAGVVLVGLMALLLIRGLHISLMQKNRLGMIMGAGCAVPMLIELIFYVLCNLGILSSTMYCPFITYGGTGMLVTCILLGIMLSIYRYQNVIFGQSTFNPAVHQ